MNTIKESPNLEVIETKLDQHLNKDYPEVLHRLEAIEHRLMEVNGGIKVLKWIGAAIGSVLGFLSLFAEHFLGKH